MKQNREQWTGTKIRKWNYFLLFLDTVLFINAMTFLSVNTVMTYFLNKLSASTLEISLLSALTSLCAFATQPFFVKIAMESKCKTRTIAKILLVQRTLFLLVLLLIPVFSKRNPSLMAVLFLIGWGMFNLFTGSYSPMYTSILNKMVPHENRGRLLGAAGAAGNLIALAGAALIGVLLKQLVYPWNYTVILILGIVLLFVDALDFWLMKEKPDEITTAYSGYWEHIRNIPVNLNKNPRVKLIILGNALTIVSTIGLGYYTLYAIRSFSIHSAQIALFAGLGVVSNIGGSVLFGLLGDHIGHKHSLMLAALFNAAAGGVLLSMHSLTGVYIAFGLSTLCLSGFNLSSSILVMQHADPNRIPVFTSANSMITMGSYSVLMILASAVIDRFSFTPVFVLVGICGLLAALTYRTLK